ncbi:Glutamate 5-kinase [uncultured archaeon]|nr:Glutamate 5-kinase [uncultured archaeon]
MKIIIKIGTAAIFDSGKKKVKEKILKKLAKDISQLTREGNEIIVVTSGAVGYGKKIIPGNEKMGLKQAQAAVGQIKLMEKYSLIFSKYHLQVAQFLLNSKDLNEKNRIDNLKETYKNLMGKAIPIVNENDVTSIEELKVGDNDTLASKLLLNMDFDILVILTEIGALIKNNRPIRKSNLFEVGNYDRMNIPSEGFGGLKSKLECSKLIVHNKKRCIIAKAEDSIIDILNGKTISTEFI